LFIFFVLVILTKVKNFIIRVNDSDDVWGDDWEDEWEQGNSSAGVTRNWLFYFTPPDVFRQNHSLIEVDFYIHDSFTLSHRFTKQTSAYLASPAARINGKFQRSQNKNAWVMEFYHHLSMKGFMSANLFKDILDASGFDQNNFLDLLFERTENGTLEKRWKHVEVVKVFPGNF